MEFLVENFEWLEEKLITLSESVSYIIIDFPGQVFFFLQSKASDPFSNICYCQVELYTHHLSVYKLLEMLRQLDCRLCSVNLIDSFYCSAPATFISAVLVSAATMLRLGLPHINVLSKVRYSLSSYKCAFTRALFIKILNFLDRLIYYICTDPCLLILISTPK